MSLQTIMGIGRIIVIDVSRGGVIRQVAPPTIFSNYGNLLQIIDK
jgi:hypothetical protein